MKKGLQREATHQDEIWEPADRAPALQPNAVHIWLVDLALPVQAFEECFSFLSPEERERAARFHFEKDRNHYIAGRGLLRKLLGDYLNVSPAALSFSYNRYGKPLLTPPAPELQFNLSHSHGWALLGFTLRAELGVDIEKMRPDFATREIAERFFAPDEVAVLASLDASQQAQAFFKCWTRKEAFIKAHGIGLSFGLDKFSVAFAPGVAPALLRCDLDANAAGQWSIVDLPVPPNYLGALAIHSASCQARLLCPSFRKTSS